MKALVKEIQNKIPDSFSPKFSGVSKVVPENSNETLQMVRNSASSTPSYCGGSITVFSGYISNGDRTRLMREFNVTARTNQGHSANINGRMVPDLEFILGYSYGNPHRYFSVRVEDQKIFEDLFGDSILVKSSSVNYAVYCIDDKKAYERAAKIKKGTLKVGEEPFNQEEKKAPARRVRRNSGEAK